MYTLCFWYITILICVIGVDALRLAAYISSNGLHGEIRFEALNNNAIRVRLAFKPTLQYPIQQWLWFLTEFPVDYTLIENRCSDRYLGKSVVDLTKLIGPLELPDNETASIEVSGLTLTGEEGIWGKGILLKDAYSERVVCSSITVLDKSVEKIAEARFLGHITGSIWFRWLGGQNVKDIVDTLIHVQLQYTADEKSEDVHFTQHRWKIYVTDIFGTDKERPSCNVLQSIFDPENAGFNKSVGDIDLRLGKIRITSHMNKIIKSSYHDPDLALLPIDHFGSQRILYLVIFHAVDEDLYLACAKIKPRKPITAKTLMNSQGIKGEVTIFQETPFNPTWINVSLSPINDLITRLHYETKIAYYRIHELPSQFDNLMLETKDPCLKTKNMYDPLNVNDKEVPPPGFGTQDQYAIGDLSGKLQGRKEGSHHLDILPGSAKLSGLYWDTYLPLSGINSVVHRSLVIHRYNGSDQSIETNPWVCGTFILQLPYNEGRMPMRTAEVIFRYPIVGKLIFRQPKHEPDMDTIIIVEQLIYADGSSLKDTYDHRWMIHNNPPGLDFYNWTSRCMSAGAIFNPYKIQWNNSNALQNCKSDILRCRTGDLSRHGAINISGSKIHGTKLTRALFTDPIIALTGPTSILGKSVIIYDDNGPKARGDRLACSLISENYRIKGIAKDWFGNGEDVTTAGKLEFVQESIYDVTDVEVDLQGLSSKMSGYHIHMTPVKIDLEFPCEDTSLYGTWNPLHINASITPAPAAGTSDQYEVGDLSGKFGLLEGRRRYLGIYNDSQLPLFGPRSILGRSVIIHKKARNTRWACATIERGYAPSEAREIKAIASFHHPSGYAYGYIRMSQLIYNTGYQSDTIIEVNLRHPGTHDRNITRNHNWAIYINPVGIDATVKTKYTRCFAGGYRWNPYFTQLADPLNDDLYKKECGADLPLRCDVGDISARLGPIDIGLERKLLVDSNFPLTGSVNAIGKSIVILEKDFGTDKFACANIEPDHDIVKYANIQKPPLFVVAQFLDDVRQVMGIPEWMLLIDGRKTKILHSGSCIQFLVHFRGPTAKKLELDFTKLISTGKLESPSISIPGYVQTKRKNTLAYRQCGTRDPNEKHFNQIPSFYHGQSATSQSNSIHPLCIASFLINYQFVINFV